MILTIYTYGYIESMFAILNGISMLFNGGAIDLLIHIISGSTMVYYILKAGASGNLHNMKISLIKCCGLILLINALLTQKSAMRIEDKVTSQVRDVDNLPLAFAMPVGYLEAFGYYLTASFDQAFSVVGSLPYTNYGMVFGSRLVREFKNQKVANPEFAYNSHKFVKRCLYDEARVGTRFSFLELESTDDLLGLVEEKGGNFRKVDFREGVLGRRHSCPRAAEKLRSYVDNELINLSRKYAKTDFGLAGTVGRLLGVELHGDHGSLSEILARNLEIAYGSTLGLDPRYDARSILQQNMMINAMHDYNSIVSLYANTRAQQQQESNWATMANLASEYLPMFLAVMKGLIYAAFIFVLPMMLVSHGFSGYYKNYLLVVLSLQLWPALNSVLNMFMEMYSTAKGTGITSGILSYATFNRAHAVADKIVTVAGGLQFATMGLSWAIVQGGVGGLIHLASGLTSASSGAASMAASEAISDNRSLRNISYDTSNQGMHNANKTDFNSAYASGASRTQMLDGAQQVVQQNGLTMLMTGEGINQSKFASPITMRDDMQETNAIALNQEQANHQSIATSLDKGLSHQEQNIDNYVKGLAKHVDAGGKVNWSELGKNAESVMNAVNHELQNGSGYNNRTEESAGMAIKASGGLKVPIIGGTTVEGSLGVSDASSQETFSRFNNAAQEHWSKNFENVVEASTNKDFGQSWGADSTLTEDIQSTRASNLDLREQEQMSKDRIDSLQKRNEEIISFGSSYDIAATHLVADRLMENGMTQVEAQRLIDNPFKANSQDRYKLNDARSSVRDELMQKISPVSSTNRVADFAGSSIQHNSNMQGFAERATEQINYAANQSSGKVKTRANNDGVSEQSVEGEINKVKAQTSGAFNDMKVDNAKRNQQMEEMNRKRLEEAEKKAKAAQPMQRAESAANYVLNKLKPPRDR